MSERFFVSQQQITEARHKAIHDALESGIESDRTLTMIAREAERELTDRVGKGSEDTFDEFTKRIKFVKSVREAPILENYLLSIDRWISLDPSLMLPDLPVQVKSSLDSVNFFKYGDPRNHVRPNLTFKRLAGLMIVVNCGPAVKFKEFRRDLFNEAQRIRELIEKNHIAPDIYIKDSNSFKIRFN